MSYNYCYVRTVNNSGRMQHIGTRRAIQHKLMSSLSKGYIRQVIGEVFIVLPSFNENPKVAEPKIDEALLLHGLSAFNHFVNSRRSYL